MFDERLPRIWLSEKVFNTKSDNGRRIFVECYPAGPDIGGERALELGDRYLGEGFRSRRGGASVAALECFQAAEILYLHAGRRGNRAAACRLREMYADDLCEGRWHESYLQINAKHAHKHDGLRRVRACAHAN